MLPHSLKALERMASIIAIQTHEVPFNLCKEREKEQKL